ncbi:protein ECT2 isoform X1 [Falco rusticolus]|uniref:protein ECT2 isoform X1 n=2 Tax=Falco TaxID=8952 RepID=UPI000FFC5055|nr:protein ECT2 isoform X1 [Falco peregrinus]XP_027650236.1 protein ECT2 isoform X1 [Falco peregrinus]XP_037262847.1 protein ECT2 isoform X1 [Falco rusticolus]XP_037262849.1 protein ECT2 isoform X1 [Falco rusticolus]XP_037262850.1 protein ECT2 isoform X1 [Falco rusticolus]XP_055579675.1 protein ECT2 isoform X1 [Falco cherrug]XP_055579676.1 protein ECT2 isoform X1 [Falco cherrug]XP_055579677.1 protein ECT2 isoform X1 [Falco cherrug]XP_055673238.1 protein ECT2 isoform X1 [Falco peregrinus]
MADNSTVVSEAGRSLLADSSVLDSKIIETSKENLFPGSALDVEEEMPQIETRVVLVQEAGKHKELLKALETIKIMEVPVIKIKKTSPGKSEEKLIKSIIHMEIKVPYIKTDTIEELGDSDSPEFETIFVVSDFQDCIFNNLCKADCRVIGPPVVLHCARKGEPLPFSCRPLYCASMLNLVLCFTGFRKKDELVKLVTLVHHMGGIIRRDFSSKVTHLVAHSTHGEKFRAAVSLGTPILKAEWIYKAWEKRNEIDFCAADDDFRDQFKVLPFQDCMLSFLGFSDDEKANMEEMTEMQGGQYLPVGDERCTHLVVEESTVKDLPFEPLEKLYVVKQEWFWGSIQMDARAGESMYLFEKSESPGLKKSVSLLSLSTPNSNRKRRRLKETLAQLTRETDMSPFPPRKRPSAEHSLSIGSLLDISNTPESSTTSGETPKSCAKPSKNSTPLPLKQSARWQVAKELYQTESNYVDILTTIIQLFQVPLEKEGQLGGPILAQEEIKTIFGSIPDILDVHTKIKEDLEDLMMNWTESRSIGDIILKYSKDLLKTYPPFVNFFEMSKETITRCEKQKPRFHAFLKINQAKPECGRQSLAELLIRPVQRLPSVALLLNDIKKHTAEENPDKVTLERAIESLKEVMTHINEDKRKTEAQRQFFDVVYEVDGCPANLLSSHRSLVQRLETVALSDDLCDRGEQVTLFLFNDCLEIARKRHKVIGVFRSPHGHTRPPASLKHVVLMPLSQIKKVLDIRETEDCHKAFALVVRPPTELNNKLFSFQMTSEEPPKEDWLKLLCRHVANTICKADAENLIYTTDPDSVEVSTKDMDSTLSRASRAIKKTSKKVTRAFSFSKTPKRALRRALMSHSATEGRSPSSANENYIGSRLTSTSSLTIAHSSSTCNLSGSVKCAVNVHRSNSADWSSQNSRPRPVVCPGSPNIHLSNAVEEKTSSNLESLNGHALDRLCRIPIITITCGDAGDNQYGAEKYCASNPDC